MKASEPGFIVLLGLAIAEYPFACRRQRQGPSTMSYTTFFSGTLTVTPPLNEHERSFLWDFNETRHTSTQHGLLDTAGPLLDGNDPQGGKPGIWCQWIANENGDLVWDEDETTYDHDAWLVWLIEHLLGPESRDFVQEHLDEDPRLAHFTHDHVVNGVVDAQGEDSGDLWRIKVTDSNVEVQRPEIVYPGDDVASQSGNPITLGADSVRAELREAPDSHDLTEAQAQQIAGLSDNEIHNALHSCIDDHFWAAYDNVRREAIAQLVQRLGFED